MFGTITLKKLLAFSKQDGVGIILSPKAIVVKALEKDKQLAVA